MASVKTDRFIILKTLKYGESDLIVQALSKSGSKMGFIAKGARKSKRRFGGGILEPTHFVELTYKEGLGTASEMGRLLFLQDAQLLNGFVQLRGDYDRLQMALYFVHLIEKVSLEGMDESEYAFNLLGNALKQLEVTEHIPILKLQFELKFLLQQECSTRSEP
ncbi:MAG: DNA repair protein RecO [Bdellovibrionales bacterium]